MLSSDMKYRIQSAVRKYRLRALVYAWRAVVKLPPWRVLAPLERRLDDAIEGMMVGSMVTESYFMEEPPDHYDSTQLSLQHAVAIFGGVVASGVVLSFDDWLDHHYPDLPEDVRTEAKERWRDGTI